VDRGIREWPERVVGPFGDVEGKRARPGVCGAGEFNNWIRLSSVDFTKEIVFISIITFEGG